MENYNDIIKSFPWGNVKRSDLEAATYGLGRDELAFLFSRAFDISASSNHLKIENDDLRAALKRYHPRLNVEQESKSPFEFVQTACYESGKFIVDQFFDLNHIGLISLSKQADDSFDKYHGTSLLYNTFDANEGMPKSAEWMARAIYSLAGARSLQMRFGTTVTVNEELNDAVAYFLQFVKSPTSLDVFYNDLLNVNYEDFITTAESQYFLPIDSAVKLILLNNRLSIDSLSNELIRKEILFLSEMKAALNLIPQGQGGA